MDKQNLICITCPVGCHLTVSHTDGGGWLVEGNQCKRGEIYAKKELTAPTRVLTTTVKVDGSGHRRLPVKTQEPIAKEKMLEAMKVINEISVKAPVKVGDVIVENVLGTGVDVVATKALK